MKLLVTGNLGYVGSHLTEILIANGHTVVGCDLQLFPNAICGTLAKVDRQIYKDFRSLEIEDLEGINGIVHLAGLSNDPMGELNAGLTQEVNGYGTEVFASLAKTAGVNIFAFASSCSVYGSSVDRPRNENDPTSPLSEYASSKLYAEESISSLSNKDFRVYILRCATAFGASPVLRTDLVVNDLSASMAAFGFAELRSDGTAWRPFINCRDMAEAFKLFIENDPKQLSGKPVNVGFNQENYQVSEIAARISEVWNGQSIQMATKSGPDPRNYQVSFELLRSTFPEFLPKHPIKMGVFELKHQLTTIPYDQDVWNSRRFVRLEELKPKLKDVFLN